MTVELRTHSAELEGTVALITGGARAQGLSHALALARAGADIIIVDAVSPVETIGYEMSTDNDLNVAVQQIESLDRRAIAVRTDVRDEDAMIEGVADAVHTLGRLDTVVANAGVLGPTRRSWEMSAKEWRTVIDVNLTGVWQTFKAAIPHVIRGKRGGSLIAISSIAGLRGVPHVSNYSAAKHGLVGLVGSVANELAEYKIRVNTVHPTNVRTPMIDNPVSAKIFRPDMELPTLDDGAGVLQRINLLPAPWVEAGDVSDAVLWLASNHSRFVTGAAIPVDAGMLAKYGG